MKAWLLILVLACFSAAQQPEHIPVAPPTPQLDNRPGWKLIKEMSGEVQGVRVDTYATQITRNANVIRISMDMQFSSGLPSGICDDGSCVAPRGVDVSTIRGITGRLKLDCTTLVVTPEKATGDLYTADGKHYKTKEPAFILQGNHVLVKYFCEEPSPKPTTQPQLKPRPSPATLISRTTSFQVGFLNHIGITARYLSLGVA